MQRTDFKNYQQESDAVANDANVAAAYTLGRYDRNVGDRESSAEEAHCDGGRVRESIWKQIQEPAKLCSFYCTNPEVKSLTLWPTTQLDSRL